jgi:hypothetical protein
MKALICLTLTIAALRAQVPICAGGGVTVLAQPEGINTSVLQIPGLQDVNISAFNCTDVTQSISEAEIRSMFPTLDIENLARAQAAGDKAFNSTKKSKFINGFNWISPVVVAGVGGGVFNMSLRAALKVAVWTSLANSAGQAAKGYLQSQQPNEAAFLPTLPPVIILGPHGSTSPPYSGSWTVLGSIAYTQPGSVVVGARKLSRRYTPSQGLVWRGTLPSAQQPRSQNSVPSSVTVAEITPPPGWVSDVILQQMMNECLAKLPSN